jgi:D-amino peptidase
MSDQQNILVICDIEGSSGCTSYSHSMFKTREWAGACLAMTRDVHAVVTALFDAGAQRVTVKDFHRTAYNLFADMIDPRAEIISGYRHGPFPGMGDPSGFDAAFFIGMHAPSGSDGFLAHTMTSRIAEVRAHGKLLSEIELFAGSLAPSGVSPVFFSGCPVACRYAKEAIPDITVFPINKTAEWDDARADAWRMELAHRAAASLSAPNIAPFNPEGPFEITVRMRDGETAARTIARRWKIDRTGDTLGFRASSMLDIYIRLARISYLTPFTEKFAHVALPLYNLYGRAGIAWARRQIVFNKQ